MQKRPGTRRSKILCPDNLLNTIRIYIVRYEWGEAKNRRNQRKHGGISFELASLVFEDERCLVGPDRLDLTGEQ